jgi:hypothetical protein
VLWFICLWYCQWYESACNIANFISTLVTHNRRYATAYLLLWHDMTCVTKVETYCQGAADAKVDWQARAIAYLEFTCTWADYLMTPSTSCFSSALIINSPCAGVLHP